MRTWMIILALAACGKKQEAPPSQGSGSATGSAVAAAPADAAPVVDAVAIDAARVVDAAPTGPAPVDADKLLDEEAIGPLRWGQPEADAIKALGGPPKKKTAPVEEGATGEFASTWTWPDVTLEMVSETRTGAAKIRLITVKGGTHATRRGIKVGSTLAEVKAAYPRSDEGGDDPTQYLVGSPYGGLLFVLKKDAVSEMVLGPMAF